MELYFTSSENITTDTATFDSFETQHLLKTMRKKQGDSLFFTDGCGHLYEGRIVMLKPAIKVEYRLVRSVKKPPRSVALAVGFIRHNRLDFMIEKVTELGVGEIYLFQSRNANYFTSNGSRWDKIARQAIKQSQRLFMPEIYTIPDFQKFLSRSSAYSKKILLDQHANSSLNEDINKTWSKFEKSVCIVGPEGGFDPDEIVEAKEHGCSTVSLGEHRLRTETAAIAAVSILSFGKN